MIRYNAYRGAPQPGYLLKRPTFRVEPVPAYRRWTSSEDADLLLLRAEGWSFGAIGRKIGRSKSACISRFHCIERAAA